MIEDTVLTTLRCLQARAQKADARVAELEKALESAAKALERSAELGLGNEGAAREARVALEPPAPACQVLIGTSPEVPMVTAENAREVVGGPEGEALARALSADGPLHTHKPVVMVPTSTQRMGDRCGEAANAACPCLYTTPCCAGCTCVNSFSSVGCLRCCSYGDPEQKRAWAGAPRSTETGLSAKELVDTLGELGLSGGAMGYVGRALENPRPVEARSDLEFAIQCTAAADLTTGQAEAVQQAILLGLQRRAATEREAVIRECLARLEGLSPFDRTDFGAALFHLREMLTGGAER